MVAMVLLALAPPLPVQQTPVVEVVVAIAAVIVTHHPREDLEW
jgi:hypothetical protein